MIEMKQYYNYKKNQMFMKNYKKKMKIQFIVNNKDQNNMKKYQEKIKQKYLNYHKLKFKLNKIK